MTAPDKLYAGDTLEFRVTVPDYPPSDGWSLTYRFVPRFSAPAQPPVTLVATVEGDEYVLFASPATTSGWVPGAYNWARWVEKTGARQVLDDLDSRGQLELLPDPAQTQQGADNRTQAQKALDDCNAALANVAMRALNAGTSGIPVEYRIGDRMMKYQTADEAHAALLTVRNHWAAVVREETRREVIARKGFDPNRVLVRF
jgi:hypothetical protein